MSSLHDGDRGLHYSDNSHRWISPPDVEQEVWEAGLRAHLGIHYRIRGGRERDEANRLASAEAEAGGRRRTRSKAAS